MPLHRRPAPARLLILLLFALAFSLPASAVDSRPQPTGLYAATRAELASLPLTVRSEERGELLTAEVEGRLAIPFAEAAALGDPAAWCDFLPLTLNVKSCTWSQDAEGVVLSIYAGRKTFQPPEAATRLDYHIRVEESSPQRLRILLEAAEGPLGIRDSRIELAAAPAGAGTALRLVSSYKSSLRSRLATDTYLSTLGREKVGFSAAGEGPRLVRGVKGMIERNAMRYYLALQAYLDTRALPEAQRFEARLRAWFGLSERYRRQLHEVEEGEYLAAKRRERQEQARLQERFFRDARR
jgi:hypothetical protein